MSRVVVGLSGGVDSAVSAALLKEQGYDVVCVFMKNWEEDSKTCTSEQDYKDAKDVANTLNLPLYTINFTKEYMDNVFKIFLDAYKKGYTPNPDVLCNSQIKFKCFLEYALTLDAKYIATGHYACIEKRKDDVFLLKKAMDKNKDQSYFLCSISQYALSKSLFPLGTIKKENVREIAKKHHLSVSNKKDSTGICFIGERNFNNFIDNYIESKPGDIINITTDEVIGRHTGLTHYTIGQRKGLKIGGIKGSTSEGAYFVVKKSVEKNELYVVQGSSSEELFSTKCVVKDPNWISYVPDNIFYGQAKFRYRQQDIKIKAVKKDKNTWIVEYDKTKAVTAGQVCAFYIDDICLGGGIIEEVE